MSEDWESVTKIGSKTRGGGGGPRETVIRGKGALNAAARSGGIIATEKKYATGNSSSVKSSSQTGQFHAKVDRTDDIVKPKVVPVEISKAIASERGKKRPIMSQKDLGHAANLHVTVITQWESTTIDDSKRVKFDQGTFKRIEDALGVRLTGAKKGEPTDKAIREEKRAAERAAGTKK